MYLYLYSYSTYTSTAKIAKTEKQQNLKNLSKTSEHSKHCKGEAAESTSDWTIVPRVHNLKSIMVQRSAWDFEHWLNITQFFPIMKMITIPIGTILILVTYQNPVLSHYQKVCTGEREKKPEVLADFKKRGCYLPH